MVKRSCLLALASLVLVGSAAAQQPQQQPQQHPPQQPPPSQYPMLDTVASKLIQKYQTSTCVQLATEKSQPPTGQTAAMEQRAVDLLKADPKLRKAFLDKVAVPIVDKLIECGMVP